MSYEQTNKSLQATAEQPQPTTSQVCSVSSFERNEIKSVKKAIQSKKDKICFDPKETEEFLTALERKRKGKPTTNKAKIKANVC